MNEPASPRWDRNKPNPEWQNDSEYNPELAAIQKEELELGKRHWEECCPVPISKRKKMSWE